MSTSTRLGPQPARTDRPRQAALRVLQALIASDERGTVATLNAALGGHANTIRVQLEHLVADGFVTQTSLPTPGRGRPARAYLATIAGRQVAGEEPDRQGQSALVEALAEHLAGTDDPAAAAHSVGLNWGSLLAASGGGELISILAGQGFTPLATSDGIALRTCPLLASARRYPDVVCGIHQGLIDAISHEPQELLPFVAAGACLIRHA
jgi:predicted ArsR family transcriptional regulator